jgi:hypothetical protein
MLADVNRIEAHATSRGDLWLTGRSLTQVRVRRSPRAQPVRLERTPRVHRPCCPPKPLEDRKLHSVSTTAIAFVPLRRNAKLTICLLDRQFPYQLPFGEPTRDYPSRASGRLT